MKKEMFGCLWIRFKDNTAQRDIVRAAEKVDEILGTNLVDLLPNVGIHGGDQREDRFTVLLDLRTNLDCPAEIYIEDDVTEVSQDENIEQVVFTRMTSFTGLEFIHARPVNEKRRRVIEIAVLTEMRDLIKRQIKERETK
jgi:hypothetical protein